MLVACLVVWVVHTSRRQKVVLEGGVGTPILSIPAQMSEVKANKFSTTAMFMHVQSWVFKRQ